VNGRMIGGKNRGTTSIFTLHVYAPNVSNLVPVGVQSIDYLKPEHIPEHLLDKNPRGKGSVGRPKLCLKEQPVL
jgi:hypothetical protein